MAAVAYVIYKKAFPQEGSQDILPQSERKPLKPPEVRVKEEMDGSTRDEPQRSSAIKNNCK